MWLCVDVGRGGEGEGRGEWVGLRREDGRENGWGVGDFVGCCGAVIRE